jgi:Domain of unknown function (DUF4041)
MVRDYSKLVLRAYNAEADNLVRALKPYKLQSAIERLGKIATVISKLGKTMEIRIADEYHRLRVKELELTADYLESVRRRRSANTPSATGCAKSARFRKNLLASGRA